MANKCVTATDILADAQDLVIIGRSASDLNKRVYAVKPSINAQQPLYAESIADESERNISAFQGNWQVDGENGIMGSSTFLTLRFDQKVLRPKGLWIPSLLEAKALETQGKLQNGVYRDYGVAVFSNEQPNNQIAERLTIQAKEMGLELPLVVPFRASDYSSNGKDISVSLITPAHPTIISGEQATQELDGLNYKANSGVRRLARLRRRLGCRLGRPC